MKRQHPLTLFFAALAAALVGQGSIAEAATGFRPLTMSIKPIESFGSSDIDERFGALAFRGGLELSSPDPQFGSLSGLDFASDGTLFAVSDTGLWFAAQPEEEDGRLIGLRDARIAPILNHGGVPLSGKRWGDAEALRIVPARDGDAAFVAFERVNDLRWFTGHEFALVRSRPVELPATLRIGAGNGGFEAVAVGRDAGPLDGALILIAEHFLNEDGNHRAWIVGGAREGGFSIARDGSYNVTDAASLPNGDLLILERAVGLPRGISMRIRRIGESDILAGGTVQGETLVEADLRYQIDNMEGMAVRTNEVGETVVALISDDNNNPFQRTVLLYFALVE
ncbi:MAG: twin-arginine translocation pathway signal [Hyphomicrobiales bacterium]|nr:twin-arginine translocation pathway signal [Hyphomicrobiales bacterium]